MKSRDLLRYTFVFALLLLVLWSCSFILDTLRTGGEKQLLTGVQITSKPVPRVIIFALDGTGPDQLLQLIRSGHASNLAALLGEKTQDAADAVKRNYRSDTETAKGLVLSRQ
jgi:hypothetical protein